MHMASLNLIQRKKRFSPESSRRTAAFDGKSHELWRSEKQQRIYLSKLIKALQQLRLNSPTATSSSSSSPTAQSRGKSVRDAADRALAVSALGKTFWSRAILANRIKLRFRKSKRRTVFPSLIMNSKRSRSKKQRVSAVRSNKKTKPAIHRKIHLLGRLIPGCGKQSVPVILEEATDYIQALDMQFRAMYSLAELLISSTTLMS